MRRFDPDARLDAVVMEMNEMKNSHSKSVDAGRRFPGRRTSLGAILLLAGMAGPSWATPLLPDPTTVVSGVPVAIQYDDAYSYSTRVLDYLYPGSGWSDSAGTGQLDLIVTTRSSGQTNSDIAGGIYSIPDPTTNPNVGSISDTWGGSSTSMMLVKNLYDYLFNVFGANTPVFTFDQNETGGNPDLLVNAKVEIIDGVGGAVLKTWSFDGTTQPGDGTYDPLSYVTAPGEICIDDVMNSVPGPTACFNNNVGSGKFDYIIYAPTMDLTPWVDDNNLFKLSWEFRDVDDGGEEITMTGRFTGSICVQDPTLPQCQTVPEPGSLVLVGLALAMAGVRSRRQHIAAC